MRATAVVIRLPPNTHLPRRSRPTLKIRAWSFSSLTHTVPTRAPLLEGPGCGNAVETPDACAILSVAAGRVGTAMGEGSGSLFFPGFPRVPRVDQSVLRPWVRGCSDALGSPARIVARRWPARSDQEIPGDPTTGARARCCLPAGRARTWAGLVAVSPAKPGVVFQLQGQFLPRPLTRLHMPGSGSRGEGTLWAFFPRTGPCVKKTRFGKILVLFLSAACFMLNTTM